MSINIIDTGLGFRSLSKRSKTTYLILHHAAAENAAVETIHQWHKKQGWAGIGYNFYIRQDGSVYKGRGWEYVGAHAVNYNSISVGICFEGNFEKVSKTMPNTQLNSGAAMIALTLEKYPTISTICGHRSVGSTACPGQYFPLDEVIKAGKFKSVSGSTDTDLNGCPYGSSTAMVKNGSMGAVVCRCQWYLNKGADTGLAIDGICGSKTEAAIKIFQIAEGLSVDGICGNYTWAALESVVSSRNGSNSKSTDSVAKAIETLAKTGIINSSGYWLENYSKLRYLDQLLINMSKLVYRSEAGAEIVSVEKGVEKLASAGAINTVDYWIENYGKLQYVDQLVINAAGRL